eukprot:scaffold6561_cov114-Isochrysis_galbana.AAC.2
MARIFSAVSSAKAKARRMAKNSSSAARSGNATAAARAAGSTDVEDVRRYAAAHDELQPFPSSRPPSLWRRASSLTEIAGTLRRTSSCRDPEGRAAPIAPAIELSDAARQERSRPARPSPRPPPKPKTAMWLAAAAKVRRAEAESTGDGPPTGGRAPVGGGGNPTERASHSKFRGGLATAALEAYGREVSSDAASRRRRLERIAAARSPTLLFCKARPVLLWGSVLLFLLSVAAVCAGVVMQRSGRAWWGEVRCEGRRGSRARVG